MSRVPRSTSQSAAPSGRATASAAAACLGRLRRGRDAGLSRGRRAVRQAPLVCRPVALCAPLPVALSFQELLVPVDPLCLQQARGDIPAAAPSPRRRRLCSRLCYDDSAMTTAP